MKLYKIILPIPKHNFFYYSSESPLIAGMRVEVSFGRRVLWGIVLGEDNIDNPPYKVKNIQKHLDETPYFTADDLKFLLSISSYYGYCLGSTLNGIISNKILGGEQDTFKKNMLKRSKLAFLSEDQASVFYKIMRKIHDGYNCFLLHGVTGSGKTEIYLEVIKEIIKKDKQVFYIVPEISLTPQLVRRVSERLGFNAVVYHSRLSPKKRATVAEGIKNGKIHLAVGARSLLFLPSNNLGLIIVDEEHEPSFKQDEIPCYNLRDMAVLKGSIFKVPVILGSATPSMESFYNSKTGKYHYIKLNRRYHNEGVQKTEIIDLKNEQLIDGILSLKLYDAVFEKIKNNEQVIIFINRKGYSSQLICKKCGKTLNCLNCSVAMTYYKSDESARCHYCGSLAKKFVCECGSNDFINFGAGTEKVYDTFNNFFPGLVLKLDADNVTSTKKVENILNDFKSGKYKILVGTQLISKGLNFPDVTLVGILNIDNIFSIPDFRNNEKAYQLLTQISGRGGRFNKDSKVIIQTFNPDMPLFSIIGKDEFYDYELNNRKLLNYPPFSRMVRFIFSHSKENVAKSVSKSVEQKLKRHSGLKVLGSAPAPVYKIKNRYRFHIIVKTDKISLIAESIDICKKESESSKIGTLELKIDVDPYFFM